jgi:hypothetical protein
MSHEYMKDGEQSQLDAGSNSQATPSRPPQALRIPLRGSDALRGL